MAKEARVSDRPAKLITVGGMDESVDFAHPSEKMVEAEGVFPYFYGMYERMLGKKLIDWPGLDPMSHFQKIFAIHQAFNGICLYGYYVQTNNKLYFHLCMAPPDLRIHFRLPPFASATYTFMDTESVHWRLGP